MKPLSVYIHWPFCLAKCHYCDFNSHVRESVDQASWKSALLKELSHYATLERQVASIFFGGGTPSLMDPSTVGALIDSVRATWPCDDNLEITLEANPTSVEASKLKAFKGAGVNRVSLGVQAMNDSDLSFLTRQHSAREALKAVELAASLFDRHSFDLIYARPNQTLAAWESELKEALAYTKGHISLYQLTIEENTPFHTHHAQKRFTLPEEGLAAELYELTQQITSAHNLPAYEVSNHATPGQESRHNLAYWRMDDYIGIGPGAHGRYNAQATRTHKLPEKWLKQVSALGHGLAEIEPLSPETILEERLMMGLRLKEGILLSDLTTIIDKNKLSQLQSENLLSLKDDRLHATPKGMLVLNHVIAQLL